MEIRAFSGRLALVIGILCITCQPKKTAIQETSIKPVVATLAKPTCTLGDSVSIQLAQPLNQIAITWDSKPIAVAQQVANAVSVATAAQKIGIHQLVVNGVAPSKKIISDTLSVELLSDVIPTEVQYSVLKTYPHQVSSFTQGLEFYRDVLYEGTGLNGQSQLMKVDLQTGKPLKTVALAEQHFGEGITVMNEKIYQLTWTSGLCFRYNTDFSLEKTFTYYTQGWGLTHRDSTLIVSDGSNKLYFFTPDFQKKAELAVYDNSGPIANLNELEYVDGYVFANIWQTNRIAQIDAVSGKVVGYLTMDRILPLGIDTKQNVLNGIAYQALEEAFYVTGKNWPTLTKIRVTNLPKPARRTLASLK